MVAAYSRGWCRAFAKTFKEFVQEPVDKRCVHCLPQGDSTIIYNRREAVRRCAEVVGLGDQIDGMEYALEENRGEVFLKAYRREPPEKAAFLGTHLGARCMGAPSEASAQTHPVQKIRQRKGHRAFSERCRRAKTQRRQHAHRTR